jgi:hypothetical protein
LRLNFVKNASGLSLQRLHKALLLVDKSTDRRHRMKGNKQRKERNDKVFVGELEGKILLRKT